MAKDNEGAIGDAAQETDIASDALPDGERREALKKLAKYSAYSAPALLALMTSAKAFPVVSGG
jgi:hypothetical protein